MAERSPFPDEEGVQLERDESVVEEIILAALLTLTSRQPQTIRRAYSNGTFPDLLRDMLIQFRVDIDRSIPTLLSTSNYGSRLVTDRLSTYKGADIIITDQDIDYIIAQNIEFILDSTNSAIITAQLEEPETLNLILPFIIGLNANQAKKLINYYNGSKAIQRVETIERTLSRMRDEALSYRAKLISVSLVEDVLEEGKIIAGNQIQLGTSKTVMKTWVCSFINSCQVCIGLHGETVPVNAPFSTGILRPKAHPNCHCALTISEVD